MRRGRPGRRHRRRCGARGTRLPAGARSRYRPVPGRRPDRDLTGWGGPGARGPARGWAGGAVAGLAGPVRGTAAVRVGAMSGHLLVSTELRMSEQSEPVGGLVVGEGPSGQALPDGSIRSDVQRGEVVIGGVPDVVGHLVVAQVVLERLLVTSSPPEEQNGRGIADAIAEDRIEAPCHLVNQPAHEALDPPVLGAEER